MDARSISELSHPLRFLSRYRAWIISGIGCLMISNGLAQAIPWVVRFTIDTINAVSRAQGAKTEIVQLVMLLLLMAAIQAVIRIFSRVLIFNAGRFAEFDLRRTLLSHLLALDGTFYKEFRTGDLMSRLTNDISAVRALFGPGCLYAANTLFAYAVAVPLMLSIDKVLTGLVLLPFPLLVLLTTTFARRIQRRSKQLQESLADMSAAAQENISGIREIKTYGLERLRHAAFAKQSTDYRGHAIGLELWRSGITPVMTLGVGASSVAVLWVGGGRVIDNSISLGDLVAFNLYVTLLAYPTYSLGWILASWQRGLAAWSRLRQLFAVQTALPDRMPQQSEAAHFEQTDTQALLELRDLSVSLGQQCVLDKVSFRIEPGQLCAIVGRVGSGKSTLAEVIGRLLPVETGSYFFNGHDVNALSVAEVRAQVAYAPQEAFLFTGSVEENIAYGLPENIAADQADGDISARVREAALLAGLEHDLKSWPAGLKTIVGEGGLALSGGQRQRTALARALIAGRPLVILDDALAAVDAETEQTVLKSLRAGLRGSAALLISHRLTALMHADQIFVLSATGQIVEHGTHTSLMKRGGHYRDLYQRQLWEQRHQRGVRGE